MFGLQLHGSALRISNFVLDERLVTAWLLLGRI